jgi:hypothetical protein
MLQILAGNMIPSDRQFAKRSMMLMGSRNPQRTVFAAESETTNQASSRNQQRRATASHPMQDLSCCSKNRHRTETV